MSMQKRTRDVPQEYNAQVCDSCGKEDDLATGMRPNGWWGAHEFTRRGDDWSSGAGGDFCSLACLRTYLDKLAKEQVA